MHRPIIQQMNLQYTVATR